MKKILKNEKELVALASGVLEKIVAVMIKTKRAYILGLSGGLGAGKTRFTQALARRLGVKDSVPSPTFVLARVYKPRHKIVRELVHIDAYRLEDEAGFSIFQLERLFEKRGTLIVMEWPERAPKKIHFDSTLSFHTRGRGREVSFREHGW